MMKLQPLIKCIYVRDLTKIIALSVVGDACCGKVLMSETNKPRV